MARVRHTPQAPAKPGASAPNHSVARSRRTALLRQTALARRDAMAQLRARLTWRNATWVFGALLIGIFVTWTVVLKSEAMNGPTALVARDPSALAPSYAPALGEAHAVVQIVAFIDPLCPGCAGMHPQVKALVLSHAGKVRLVTRHVAFHQGSWFIVQILEASKKQGKYWQTLDALLASRASWVAGTSLQPREVWSVLETTGLDLDRLRFDMGDPENAERLARDMNEARALRITRTPAYYVNGRPLPRLGIAELRNAVDEALATSAAPG